jgi:hypothetical protein
MAEAEPAWTGTNERLRHDALVHAHDVLTMLYGALHDTGMLAPAVKQALLDAIGEAAPLIGRGPSEWMPGRDIPALHYLRDREPERWRRWATAQFARDCDDCAKHAREEPLGMGGAEQVGRSTTWVHRSPAGVMRQCETSAAHADWQRIFRPEEGTPDHEEDTTLAE